MRKENREKLPILWYLGKNAKIYCPINKNYLCMSSIVTARCPSAKSEKSAREQEARHPAV